MNRLLLLLVAAAAVVGVAVAQDPSGNPIYDVQYAAEAVHQLYEGTFDNIRFYSSDILNEQNNDLLNVALESISSWGTAAQQKKEVNAQDTVEVRLKKILTTFNTEAIGDATRLCISTATTTLQARQEAILQEIERGRYKSTELQLKALEGLTDFNILINFTTYYDTMTPIVYEYLDYLQNVSSDFPRGGSEREE